MLINFSLFTLFSLSFLTSSSHSSSSPIPYFNISQFLYPFSEAVADEELHDHSQPTPFFKGVLEAIADKEKWNLTDVRISKLDLKKGKFGDLKRYEFRVRFGKSEFVFKLLDQVSRWKRIQRVNNEYEFETLIREISSKAVLDTFKIQGPFHLRVSGDDKLTLILPLNASFAGLKHIYIREGIAVEVRHAKEVSLLHTMDPHKVMKGGIKSSFEYFQPSLCKAWPPIRIVGSATVVAYRTRNPDAPIETFSPSEGAIELLPEKCYSQNFYRRWGSSIETLSTRMAFLEKVVQSFVGMNRNGSDSLSANIIASSLFRFQLEVKRDIRSNDTHWSTIAEWRTKPTVEHLLFEVVARIEAGVFKPLIIKKIKPFIQVDSKAWSNLMANISFTNFPSILVPQEALTLDVKW